MSEAKKSPLEAWAIVEIMGHQRVVGKVTEEVIAGAAMLRVDVPMDEVDAYRTEFVGGNSIYRLRVVSEEAARIAAARISQRDEMPIHEWELPDHVRSALRQIEFDEDHQEHVDECPY